MTKNERLELNELSLKVYGKSSQWRKMVEKGEKVPKVKTDEDKLPCFEISRYSVEEIKTTMEELFKEEQEKALNEMTSESEKFGLYEQEEKEIKLALEEEAKNQAAKIKKMAGETEEKVEEYKQDVIKEILETVES